MTDYSHFLASKHVRHQPTGFHVELDAINQKAFDWQKLVIQWAVRRGRAALFEDCGLGKSIQMLEWSRIVNQHTGRNVLILCPLAVQWQLHAEADKFGIPGVHVAESQSDVQPGITITNYDKLHHFDASQFVGVCLDESSILKSYAGTTKRKLIETFARTPYRLACTATPAPNDMTEIGNHSEFLGVMPSPEMLSRWFINDGAKTGVYRLRNHGIEDYWRWVASWAVAISSPADLGFPSGGYDLPPFKMREHVIAGKPKPGQLFATHDTISATEVHEEKRQYLEERAAKVAEIVQGDDDHWIVWVDTDYEADAVLAAIPLAVEVRGSDSNKYKENSIKWFIGGGDCPRKDRAWLGRKSICVNTENNTSKGLKSSSDSGSCERLTKTNGTQEEESGTESTQNTERCASDSHEKSANRSEWNTDSGKSLDSRSKSTKASETGRGGSVPSAEQTKPTPGDTDFTSTTAMQQEKSEGCCAESATLQSEGLKTQSSTSTERLNTSGDRKRVLICKAEMFGFGLNFQHCHKMTWFAGYSYEKFYQALRRLWRFGQSKTVECHLIRTENESSVCDAVNAKQARHAEFQREVALRMSAAMKEELGLERQLERYVPTKRVSVPNWMRSRA